MNKRDILLDLINKECLSVGGDYQLSTGSGSDFYFDCKKATLDGEGLNYIVDLVLEEISKLPEKPKAIGGLTIGADPIISGVILKDCSIKGSIVRKERKKHGTKNKIENQQPSGTTIVVVDDVVTSGGSTIAACDELEKEGYKVVAIIALIDREAGGLERLSNRYNQVTALFRKSDFPKLRSQLGDDGGRPEEKIAAQA